MTRVCFNRFSLLYVKIVYIDVYYIEVASCVQEEKETIECRERVCG